MGQAQATQTQRASIPGIRNVSIKPKTTKKEFVILCPRIAENDGVPEATQALLYLPQNYKLIIATDAHDDVMYDEVTVLSNDASKAMRTSLRTETMELPAEVTPFSFADVVIYGGPGPTLTNDSAQSLIVFNIAAGRVVKQDDGHEFRVCANSPEALATAILSVTQS